MWPKMTQNSFLNSGFVLVKNCQFQVSLGSLCHFRLFRSFQDPWDILGSLGHFRTFRSFQDFQVNLGSLIHFILFRSFFKSFLLMLDHSEIFQVTFNQVKSFWVICIQFRSFGAPYVILCHFWFILDHSRTFWVI